MTLEIHVQQITDYVATLPDRIDLGSPLFRTEGGHVAGRFLNARVASVFQPVMDLHRQRVVGHQGLLRVEAPGDSPLAPWSLFALTAGDAMLRHLDRLCRTLHTLNYFAHVDASQSLFLNVEERLLASVPDEHGRVFEGVLGKFGLSPQRVVIVFPRSVIAVPDVLARGARNYRARGYRVMVPISRCDERVLGMFNDAPVDLVKVDVSASLSAERLAAVAMALGENGVSLLAGRVESADLLKKVIDAGVEFAQGFVLGAPAALARRPLSQADFGSARALSHPDAENIGRGSQ